MMAGLQTMAIGLHLALWFHGRGLRHRDSLLLHEIETA